jgi:capsular polysaccharide biosynthesis protein
MEPRHYLAVLVRRWVTLAFFGILGVLGSGLLTALTPPTYSSTTSLLFSVPGGALPGDVSQDAQYVESTITSLIAVARSAAVLGPVIDRGEFEMTTTELAETLTVGVVENTTILEISAAAPSPSQAASTAGLVSEQLQVALAELSPGEAGPLDVLRATTVAPATEPEAPSSPNLKRNVFLGAAAGLAVGVLVALYREAVGARITSMRDVGVLTDLPVWPVHREPRGWLSRLSRFRRPADTGGQRGRRSEDLRRLSLALDSIAQDRSARSVSVQSPQPRRVTASLATGLAEVMSSSGRDVAVLDRGSTPTRSGAGEPDLIVVGSLAPSSERPASSPDRNGGGGGALAIVEPGKTRRRALQALLSRGAPAGSMLLGVVLADKPPDLVVGPRALLRRLANPTPPALPAEIARHENAPALVARSTVFTALAALVLAGMAYGLPFGTNTAFLATAALTPVWFGAVARYRYAFLILGLASAALVAGLLLADRSSVDHVIDGAIATDTSLRFLGALGTVGLILWARTFLPIWRIALAYGAGWLLTGVIQLPGTPNPWKFQLAFGVTFIVLALVTAQRRTRVSVAALSALALVSALLDFRSWFAFCAVTAGLLVWQARPRAGDISKPTSRLVSLLFLAALAVGSYAGATYAIVGGYLGDELQARSVQQIRNSGSLIVGGRPEWSITWVLMQRDPFGFGIGVVPNSADILAGKEGFATVNVVFQPDYAEFLFGGQFKLHSVTADFWSNFGILGLVLAGTISVVLLAGFTRLLTRRQASPLAVFLVVANMWNLAFQPIYSSLPSLALALGVVLWPREDARADQARPAVTAVPEVVR